jgi:hypothetical protein
VNAAPNSYFLRLNKNFMQKKVLRMSRDGVRNAGQPANKIAGLAEAVIGRSVKCTKRFALPAALKLKCLSAPAAIVQCIAVIVLRAIKAK